MVLKEQQREYLKLSGTTAKKAQRRVLTAAASNAALVRLEWLVMQDEAASL
jgi:hypothetical protein